jgi:hypothetical protein
MEPTSNHPRFDHFVLWFAEQDEKLLEVVELILNGDPLVDLACKMLSDDGGESPVLTPRTFRNSKIVRKLVELCGA